jgi:hypothetical protein
VPRGPLLHQRPAKALDIWLAIYYAFIIGHKWRTWSVRPVPPAFYVAALLLLSCRASLQQPIFTCYVLYIAHEYSYQHGTFNIKCVEPISAGKLYENVSVFFFEVGALGCFMPHEHFVTTTAVSAVAVASL